jgi:hypothetical protein
MTKKTLLSGLLIFASSCALNPFSKEEPVYRPVQEPTPQVQGVGLKKSELKGVKNVVYYMKRAFSPIKGEVVLNSYDGYLIDVGSSQGVSVGDRFISQSGAVLKVVSVNSDYSTALPTLGKPVIGEEVERLTFNKVLFLDFTKKRGKELYEAIKKEVKGIHLAPYSQGEKVKREFHLRYPSDFRRKVPVEKLPEYDGFIVVSDRGAAVYDSTKKLIKFFPWEGPPLTAVTFGGKEYEVVLNFHKHATSMFLGNLDESPEPEAVITTENDLRVYRIFPHKAQLLYKFKNPFPGSYLFHVCPLKREGKLLFVVDGFYQNDKSVTSGLFQLVNGKLKELGESNLILSCFDTNGDGENDALYGQEVSKESDKLFSKKVYLLRLEGGKFVKVKRIQVPEGFQVTSGQLFKSNGKEYFAYYDLNYYFNVADGTKVVWRSPIQIGASPNCLYWNSNDMLISYYVTPKPKAVDTDGDGNQEVYFSQNKNAVPGILRNIYTFDGGRILMLFATPNGFDWEEATDPIYKLGGIEEFGYSPELDAFVAIFTKVNILTRPKSKLLIIKPKE